MAYEVEKDVPMTPRRKYPFDDMGVGDSFFLPVADREKINSAARYYGKREDKKFSIKKFDNGYRCWRIE